MPSKAVLSPNCFFSCKPTKFLKRKTATPSKALPRQLSPKAGKGDHYSLTMKIIPMNKFSKILDLRFDAHNSPDSYFTHAPKK